MSLKTVTYNLNVSGETLKYKLNAVLKAVQTTVE